MYHDRDRLPPNSAAAQTMQGAIDGAAWNAVRALHMLDELDGVQKATRHAQNHGAPTGGNSPLSYGRSRVSPRRGPTIQDYAAPSSTPAHRDTGTGAAQFSSVSGVPASTPANRDMGTSAQTPIVSPAVVKGSDVILLDSRVVGTLCAKIKCKVPPSITQYCGGLAVGKMVSRAGEIAVVDFGSDIFTVPYQALTSVQNLSSVRRKAAPPQRDTKEMQVSQLVRSLKLKADALRRKDDELVSSKKEVFLLKRQLDKAGMASWVHAQVLDERVLFLPKADTVIPVGTDITHHLDENEGEGGEGDPDANRRPPSVEGTEIVLGAEKYCSLVVNGQNMYAHNATDDMQIDFCLKLGQEGVQGSKRVLWSPNAPRTFTIRIFPGETLPIAELNNEWDSRYSVSFSYGPVADERFLNSLKQDRGQVTGNEMNVATGLATENGVDYTRVSALEHMIELCVTYNAMFVDMQFPPTSASLTDKGKQVPVSWMRPQQFMKSPVLFKSSPQSGNIIMGGLGDCFFIDAVSALVDAGAGNDGYLIKRLLTPPLNDAALQKEQSLGIYRISLCMNGWWNWHVVDSCLPMEDGLHTKLAYARCKDPDELWLAILQKAYAKSHGTYHDIIHGNVAHVLADLSGFPTEVIDWQQDHLFDILIQHFKEGHPLLLTSTSMDITTTVEEVDRFKEAGIMPGRVHAVLDIRYFEDKDLSLIKVQNTIGESSVWNGDWANDAPAWGDAPEVAEACDRTDEKAIWMSFRECRSYFDNVGALLVTHNWWDLRFKTGFYDSRPAHSFVFTVFKDTDALVSVVQSDHEKHINTHAAIRVEVIERTAKGRWETVVESDARFTRGRDVHTSFFSFRAGCVYSVLLHQWSKEENAYCRNKKDVVLRVATKERNFGVLKVVEMTREMTECLHYEGYPGFSPSSGQPVYVDAQEDAVDCESRVIMPEEITSTLPADALDTTSLTGSAVDSDDDEGISIVSQEREIAADPHVTASRLRMHIGTVLENLHPDDRELLCGIADNLERGEGAMQNWVGKLYR